MRAIHRAVINALPGTTHQIHQELYRQGVNVTHRVIRKTLMELQDKGYTHKHGGHMGRWL